MINQKQVRILSAIFLLNLIISLNALADDIYEKNIIDDGSFLCTLETTKRKKRMPCWGPRIGAFVSTTLKDVFVLQANLFSWDSLKTIIAVFPFFVGARMIDEKLHNCFYVRRHHRNVNQLPSWCEQVAEWSLAPPITFFGLQAFFAKDDEMRLTCQTFLIGMPFVVFANKLIKQLDFDACFRPWNQNFDCHQRALGGFPSGHLGEATYMAMLFGMRFGYRYAIPLSFLAAVIGVTFLNCNRHYASQMIAGAGFGALYALAADKLITSKLSDRISCSITFDRGGPALAFSGSF